MIFTINARENVTVYDWPATGSGDESLWRIRFADGTVWSVADVNAMESGPIVGTAGSDYLEGGAGDDMLIGQDGDDTYVWNPGGGNDTIWDSSGFNTLEFGHGVEASDVSVSRQGDDLVFSVAGGGQITVQRWYDVDNLSEDVQLGAVLFADGTVWERADINALVPGGGATNGNDVIRGTPGDDVLEGLAGDDTIYGGEGDDNMNGEAGTDTYIWNLGDGNDIINDYDGSTATRGTLRLGEGVAPESIEISRSGDDIIFVVKKTGEYITVRNWYKGEMYQFAGVEFASGTIWAPADINAMRPAIWGTDTGEIIQGTAENDIIYGHGGDDTLNGGAGDDILYGGDGNDRLNGGVGNDTLIGGAGNDNMDGGSGSDTYIWNLGDGNDRIIENTTNIYEFNVLQFGEGIDPGQVRFSRDGSDAQRKDAVFIMPSGERVTVVGWFNSNTQQLNEVRFADGTVWTTGQINAMNVFLQGTEEGDTITGSSGNDIIYGGAGNDTISGINGNDTLIGGEGDDMLIGGHGNDTYIWNIGDGNDTISDWSGANALVLGEGVDPSMAECTRSESDLILLLNDESNGQITFKGWFNSANGADRQFAQFQFADGTVWTTADVNAIAAGTLAPFSTTPAPMSAPMAAPLADDGEVAAALSLLAAPASPLAADVDSSLVQSLREEASAFAAPASAASVPTASRYRMESLAVDLAVAQLHFTANEAEQVCDLSGCGSSCNANLTVSTSAEDNLQDYFGNREENRQSA